MTDRFALDEGLRGRLLQESGQRLPDPLRLDLERFFARSLDDVMVRSGGLSDEIAANHAARGFAFAGGVHRGRGAPLGIGQAALEFYAHEVAHLVQLADGRGGLPDATLEREAHALAGRVRLGRYDLREGPLTLERLVLSVDGEHEALRGTVRAALRRALRRVAARLGADARQRHLAIERVAIRVDVDRRDRLSAGAQIEEACVQALLAQVEPALAAAPLQQPLGLASRSSRRILFDGELETLQAKLQKFKDESNLSFGYKPSERERGLLFDLLGGKNAEGRRLAFEALQYKSLTSAEETRLIQLLGTTSLGDVQLQVAKLLGANANSLSETQCAQIVALLPKLSEAARVPLLEGFRYNPYKVSRQGKAFLELLKTTRSPAARLPLVKLIAQSSWRGRDQALTELLATLQGSKDGDVARAIAAHLEKTSDAAGIVALTRAVVNGAYGYGGADKLLQAIAALVLATRGSTPPREHLAKELKKADASQAEAWLAALRKAGIEDHLPSRSGLQDLLLALLAGKGSYGAKQRARQWITNLLRFDSQGVYDGMRTAVGQADLVGLEVLLEVLKYEIPHEDRKKLKAIVAAGLVKHLGALAARDLKAGDASEALVASFAAASEEERQRVFDALLDGAQRAATILLLAGLGYGDDSGKAFLVRRWKREQQGPERQKLRTHIDSEVRTLEWSHERAVQELQREASWVRADYQRDGLSDEYMQKRWPDVWATIQDATDLSEIAKLGTMHAQEAQVVRHKKLLLGLKRVRQGIILRKEAEEILALRKRVDPTINAFLAKRYANSGHGEQVAKFRGLTPAWEAFVKAHPHLASSSETKARFFELLRQWNLDSFAQVELEAMAKLAEKDHVSAYRAYRRFLMASWTDPYPILQVPFGSKRDELANLHLVRSPQYENYKKLGESFRESSEELLKLWESLDAAVAGRKSYEASWRVDNIKQQFYGRYRDSYSRDHRKKEEHNQEFIRANTLEDMLGLLPKLKQDPIFPHLAVLQLSDQAEERHKAQLAIARYLHGKKLFPYADAFYRALFGLTEELPGDTDKRRAVIDPKKPSGGLLLEAWNEWIDRYDPRAEVFNWSDETWEKIKTLAIHGAIILVAGLVSGGVGAAMEAGVVATLLTEAAVFTITSKVLEEVVGDALGRDLGGFKGGLGGLGKDFIINALMFGVLKGVGVGYTRVFGVNPARLRLAEAGARQYLGHTAGALIIENLALDGFAIAVAAAEAKLHGKEFTADQALEIVVTNFAMIMGLKCGSLGVGWTMAKLGVKGKHPWQLREIDRELEMNAAKLKTASSKDQSLTLARRNLSLLQQKERFLLNNYGSKSTEYKAWKPLYEFVRGDMLRLEAIQALEVRAQADGAAGGLVYRPTEHNLHQLKALLDSSGVKYKIAESPQGLVVELVDPITGAKTYLLPVEGATTLKPNLDSLVRSDAIETMRNAQIKAGGKVKSMVFELPVEGKTISVEWNAKREEYHRLLKTAQELRLDMVDFQRALGQQLGKTAAEVEAWALRELASRIATQQALRQGIATKLAALKVPKQDQPWVIDALLDQGLTIKEVETAVGKVESLPAYALKDRAQITLLILDKTQALNVSSRDTPPEHLFDSGHYTKEVVDPLVVESVERARETSQELSRGDEGYIVRHFSRAVLEYLKQTPSTRVLIYEGVEQQALMHAASQGFTKHRPLARDGTTDFTKFLLTNPNSGETALLVVCVPGRSYPRNIAAHFVYFDPAFQLSRLEVYRLPKGRVQADFASDLKSARVDPDVILLGNVREVQSKLEKLGIKPDRQISSQNLHGNVYSIGGKQVLSLAIAPYLFGDRAGLFMAAVQSLSAKPRTVVFTGTAGGFGKDLRVGDIVAPESFSDVNTLVPKPVQDVKNEAVKFLAAEHGGDKGVHTGGKHGAVDSILFEDPAWIQKHTQGKDRLRIVEQELADLAKSLDTSRTKLYAFLRISDLPGKEGSEFHHKDTRTERPRTDVSQGDIMVQILQKELGLRLQDTSVSQNKGKMRTRGDTYTWSTTTHDYTFPKEVVEALKAYDSRLGQQFEDRLRALASRTNASQTEVVKDIAALCRDFGLKSVSSTSTHLSTNLKLKVPSGTIRVEMKLATDPSSAYQPVSTSGGNGYLTATTQQFPVGKDVSYRVLVDGVEKASGTIPGGAKPGRPLVVPE